QLLRTLLTHTTIGVEDSEKGMPVFTGRETIYARPPQRLNRGLSSWQDAAEDRAAGIRSGGIHRDHAAGFAARAREWRQSFRSCRFSRVGDTITAHQGAMTLRWNELFRSPAGTKVSVFLFLTRCASS